MRDHRDLERRSPSPPLQPPEPSAPLVAVAADGSVRPDAGPPPPPKPKYTHVIVFGGVNDLYSDVSGQRTMDKITADLTLMYTAARAAGLSVVAITVAPWGGFRHHSKKREGDTRELNHWLGTQKKAGLVDFVIDSRPVLTCGNPTRLCPRYEVGFNDGLHFGAEGHERLGEALLDQVFGDCR